jgi:hypothetical protein
MQNQGWRAGHEMSPDKKYFLTVAVINISSPTVRLPAGPAEGIGASDYNTLLNELKTLVQIAFFYAFLIRSEFVGRVRNPATPPQQFFFRSKFVDSDKMSRIFCDGCEPQSSH